MPKKESNNLKDLTYFKSHVSPGPCSKADEVHSNKKMKRTKDCMWKFSMQECHQVL